MGIRGIDKINDLYDRYLQAKAGSKVSVSWLRKIVAFEIGSSERTVDVYMHQMSDFGFIKATKEDKVEILARGTA